MTCLNWIVPSVSNHSISASIEIFFDGLGRLRDCLYEMIPSINIHIKHWRIRFSKQSLNYSLLCCECHHCKCSEFRYHIIKVFLVLIAGQDSKNCIKTFAFAVENIAIALETFFASTE